jgi:predicted amino acid-binding ACT domain protein
MAGSFVLTLDTTGPDIEISIPSYSTKSVNNQIVVQGTEPLAPWQDFYFIDAAGERHNFIFSHDNDRFIGLVRFNQFALGVAVFYAHAKDVADNSSPLSTKAINILQGSYMTVHGTIIVRPMVVSFSTRNIDSNETQRQVLLSRKQQNLEVVYKLRGIEVETV